MQLHYRFGEFVKTHEMTLPEKWLAKPISLLKTAFVKRMKTNLGPDDAPIDAAALAIQTPGGDPIPEGECIRDVLKHDSNVVFKQRSP